MSIRQWVGGGTDWKYLSLQTKAVCAGVCQALPISAVLAQTSHPQHEARTE